MFFCFSFIGNLFHKTLHSSIVSANFPKFFCWMVLYSSAHFCIIKPPAIRHEYFLKSWSLSQKSSFCDCRVEGYFGFDCPSSVSISFFSIKGGSLTTLSKQKALYVIFTILVSFSQDNALLFASKAKINVFWNFFEWSGSEGDNSGVNFFFKKRWF